MKSMIVFKSFFDKRRVDAILDGEGLNIVKYTYDDLGQVIAAKVGARLERDYTCRLHERVG